MIGTSLSNFRIQPGMIAKISNRDTPKLGKAVCEFLFPPIKKG